MVIRLASSTNIGWKEMAGGRRRRRREEGMKAQMLNYACVSVCVLAKGGWGGGIPPLPPPSFPRSQCVNHPLHGSHNTGH